MSDDPLFLSILELGRRYRDGSLSPTEVTRLSLERIERLELVLNAFITVTAERALEAAGRAEEELRGGLDRGPLHGVPVALKDLVDVAGVRTTCGSRIWANHIPERDAPITTRLEASGAVLVGKTNMLEFAYGIVHPDHGQTNNPWDVSRTAGGSSGGSAAAVAAGLCFAAVGTDTGGSIRIPASYCGVAGLKPSYGLVDLEGVFPLSWSLDHVGSLARTSGDARLLLEALTGRSLALEREVSGLRVGVLRAHVEGPEMQPEVTAVFERACETLRKAGALLTDVTVPDLDLADAALLNVLLPEASAIHARWLAERPQDYAPDTRTQLELGFAVPAVTHVRAGQYRRHLARQFARVFGEVEVLLTPTAPWVAPHEDPAVAGDEGAAEARRTGPHNLTGFPAHSVNGGFSGEGLPVGLQIVTPPRQDALALWLGGVLEGLLGSVKVPTDPG